ncbi:protein tweety homolog 1-like isoform X3 [Dermatophagoides pteronyssinus]|uniref:Protein tweety homolog n=1 Tax=Dermatophagoides pteronyssinus TaxID=6956 RepID=A0A6P6Y1Q2_DERPT|nr:protein tweety-like isoform X3 [Dermatophagoides pteronyssinus]
MSFQQQEQQHQVQSQSLSEMYFVTVTKIEDFLDDLTTMITNQLSMNDPSLTVTTHESLYNMSIVAEWFHSIPHVDIKLRPLPANITFDPNDNEYLESLGILVAIPGFWLILTLIFFLVFFLCRCCDGPSSKDQQKQFHQQATLVSKTPKPKRLTGCKICLALLAVIAGFAITVSLLGSIIVHRGMVRLGNSTADIANIIETVQNDTRTAAYYLHDEIDVNIESLKGAVEKMLVKDVAVKANLENQVFFLKRNVSRCMRRVDDIYSRIEKLNIRPVPDNVQLIEKIRWPSTFAFAFYLIIFCLILLCGLVRHSRCTLILFSVFGLLALVLGWVLSSLYLGLLVAGSDFCAEPDAFLDDRFSNEAEMAILDYYIRCRLPTHQQQQPIGSNHPFRVQTRASLIALDHMSELIRALEMLCISYCSPDQSVVRPQINSIVQHLNSTERLLKSVQALLDCRRIHDDFVHSMSATCKDLIEGLFLLLITSSAIGLLFTLLVLCASHTWIHIRSVQSNSTTSLISTGQAGSSTLMGQLDNADETDPFLPPTPRNLLTSQHPHHTILSNNSTSSSLTNASLSGKRFRDSYSSAYGTTGRGRLVFSHTPPQTPHFTTLGGGVMNTTTTLNPVHQQQHSQSTLTHHGTIGRILPRSEEQLAFLSPPPAYDQLNQQQLQQQQQLQLQQQQQQQLQHQQQQHQHQQQQQQLHYHHQHQLYGTHHTGTLPHAHHHHSHLPTTSTTTQQHQAPMVGHNQSAIGHYMYSSFGHPS